MTEHDTAPIRTEERFDEEVVAAYLREHLPELVGAADIRFDQFPGGAANLTYRAVAGDVELVLRRAPLGEVAKGGHDMAREHRVLSRLWSAFPAAPRAYHYCDDAAVLGKPFFVMERRRGYVVRTAWPEVFGDDPGVRRRVCEHLVDTLADLHEVDPAAVGLGDLGRPSGFVERQVIGWGRRWDAAKTRDVQDMDMLTGALLREIPDPQTAAILHNDYKLDNTMVSAAGDLVAVFDWDMATRGDPLVDLGALIGYWVDTGGTTQVVFGSRVQALTPYMSKSEVVERYATRTGFDMGKVRFYVALAYYRVAVILEQIYTRYARGQTTDERFAEFSAAAPLLAATAREVLEGGDVL
ncbi:MAG: phosphotransferase family protein [Acidimicrobiia bacterium]